METTAPELTIDTAQWVSELLVTDTRTYEVIGRTAQTMTIRATRATGETRTDESCDRGAYGLAVVWEAQEADPDGVVYRVRRRKDGTFRLGSHRGAHALRPVAVPERRVDYRR